ncbi:hypothetical protein TWF696_001510 [Orbilia brochopaga]|uniref:Uncharacterized protein n=1 Tax=Orbilia brochopaga TaxID=3140254 RepID=A0AAV9UCF5_9PEZI
MGQANEQRGSKKSCPTEDTPGEPAQGEPEVRVPATMRSRAGDQAVADDTLHMPQPIRALRRDGSDDDAAFLIERGATVEQTGRRGKRQREDVTDVDATERKRRKADGSRHACEAGATEWRYLSTKPVLNAEGVATTTPSTNRPHITARGVVEARRLAEANPGQQYAFDLDKSQGIEQNTLDDPDVQALIAAEEEWIAKDFERTERKFQEEQERRYMQSIERWFDDPGFEHPAAVQGATVDAQPNEADRTHGFNSEETDATGDYTPVSGNPMTSEAIARMQSRPVTPRTPRRGSNGVSLRDLTSSASACHGIFKTPKKER